MQTTHVVFVAVLAYLAISVEAKKHHQYGGDELQPSFDIASEGITSTLTQGDLPWAHIENVVHNHKWAQEPPRFVGANKTACSADAFPSSAAFKRTSGMCVQLDLDIVPSGVLQASFALAGSIAFDYKSRQLEMTVMVGGGISLSLGIKASLYLQGEITGTVSLPTGPTYDANTLAIVAFKDFMKGLMSRQCSNTQLNQNIDKLVGWAQNARNSAEFSLKDDKSKEASYNKVSTGLFESLVSMHDTFIRDVYTAVQKQGDAKIAEFQKTRQKDPKSVSTPEKLAQLRIKEGAALYDLLLKEVTKAWRAVFIGPTTGYPSCSKLCPKCTQSDRNAKIIICAATKYGVFLEAPKTSWKPWQSGSEENIAPTIEKLYPELFGEAGQKDGLAVFANIKMANEKQQGASGEDRWFSQWFYFVLAADPVELKKHLVEITKAAQNPPPIVEKLELTGSWGITAGSSIVGFCTPDSNVFQYVTHRKYEWDKNQKVGKSKFGSWRKVGQESILTFQMGSIGSIECKHGFVGAVSNNGDGSYSELNFQIRIPVNGLPIPSALTEWVAKPDMIKGWQKTAILVENSFGQLTCPTDISKMKDFVITIFKHKAWGEIPKQMAVPAAANIFGLVVAKAGGPITALWGMLTKGITSLAGKFGEALKGIQASNRLGFDVQIRKAVNPKHNKRIFKLVVENSFGYSGAVPAGCSGLKLNVGAYMNSGSEAEFDCGDGAASFKM